MIKTICVAGAGTMGSGIAFVCAQNGFDTLLFDIDIKILAKAIKNFKENIENQIIKGKITSQEGDNLFRRIKFVSVIHECIADLFIEAVIEDVAAKISLLNQLAANNFSGAILASNTSSIPISIIQQQIHYAERVIGMHFFNPPALMKLVEVIPGKQTSADITKTIFHFCKQLGKTPVLCKDSPGFIVNRIARQYYLEAMNLVALKVATIEDIDAIMESIGFRMGPFKLMDLIGLDINLAVSQSIFHAFNEEERFRPAELQIEKVAKKEFGKKTGKGFYNYPAC